MHAPSPTFSVLIYDDSAGICRAYIFITMQILFTDGPWNKILPHLVSQNNYTFPRVNTCLLFFYGVIIFLSPTPKCKSPFGPNAFKHLRHPIIDILLKDAFGNCIIYSSLDWWLPRPTAQQFHDYLPLLSSQECFPPSLLYWRLYFLGLMC